MSGNQSIGVLRTKDGSLSRLYILLIFPILLALNIVFVPFHAPDDFDHLKKAYTLAHGSVWPITQSGKAGGYIDDGLAQAIEAQKPVIFQWPRGGPVSLHDPDPSLPKKMDAHWSGKQVFSESGASTYLPLVYVPQAAALWVSEKLDLTIGNSVFVARVVNGAIAVLIISAALVELPFGTGSILLVLLLPKTLLQFASNSADPILHALTLVIIAFFTKALVHGWVPRATHFFLVSLCILTVAGTRPPMAIVALLPLWIAWRRRNLTASIIIVGAVSVAAMWFGVVLQGVIDSRCGVTGTFGEKVLTFLTHGPTLIARSLWWFKDYYYSSFVGELGWGNGPKNTLDKLPIWVYVAAAPMILWAVAYDMGKAISLPLAYRAILLLSSLGIAAAIFFVMYAACTNPTDLAIGGVQGRYFVTSAFLAMPALAGIAKPIRIVERLYAPALFSFTLLTFTTLMFEGLRIYWISQ